MPRYGDINCFPKRVRGGIILPVKVEFFVSQPPCSGGRLLLKLMEEIRREYGDKIEVEIHRGPDEKAKEYGLKVSPTLIIDGDIRIIGVCPTKKTIREALREAGIL